jgi:6-phosphogluconolactonase
MVNLNRRVFLKSTSAAAVAAAASTRAATTTHGAAAGAQRVFLASGAATDGILAFDWDSATGELKAAGVAASLSTVDWITFSPDRRFVYAACELDSFNGKPTGEVASFSYAGGQLKPLSAQNSAAVGTCHVAIDHTGHVLISADYGGGAAASFRVIDGKLGPYAWSEHYTEHGPTPGRQDKAHAHFVSFSPDNRFAYINDLGGDCIHIYRVNTETAMLTAAGAYHAKPGSGCRTLHFHPNDRTAYCVNELLSTVDVLDWHKADGSLTRVNTIELLPEGYHGPTKGCDTVITKDGRFVYFANRDNNFLYSFHADAKTGALTAMNRSSCGGKTPRSFTLDPTERWMLVANQDSNVVSVFARDAQTGVLAGEGKNFPAATPMCILFA